MMKRYSGLFIGLLFCMAVMVGCGKSGTAEDPNRIVYIAEFKDLNAVSGDIGQLQEMDGSLYMVTGEYSEETQTMSNKLFKIDVATGDQEEISLFDIAEEESINGFAKLDNGNFAMLTASYGETGGRYYLYRVSPQGEKLEWKEISGVLGADEYLQNMTGDGQGNLYLTVSGQMNGGQIIGIDFQSSVRGKVEFSDWIDRVYCTADGGVYITAWGESGMVLRKADMVAGTFGGDIKLEGLSSGGNVTLTSGGPTGMLISDMGGIYTCDPATGQCEKVLDWLESNVNANDIRMFGVAGDGVYWAVNQTWGMASSSAMETNVTSELIVLNQTTVGELPEKEVLTYGTLSVGYNIRAAIVQFNKTNPRYRIQVKEYMEGDWEKYEENMIRMNTEITGSNAPDIIELSGGMDYKQAFNKGAMADLYSIMEKDETFSKDDYLDNVLKAYETDGKLYGIMPGFYLNAMVGSAGKLEGIDRWNLDEFLAFGEKYPDAKMFKTSADGVLFTMLSTNMNEYVDWDTGKCSFDQPNFIRVLEYANTFGTEYDDWADPDRIGIHEGIQMGKYLLMDQYISELTMMQLMKGMFDGPVKWIGYPTAEGNGIMLEPAIGLGISSRSKEKDGAWEFISFLLSDDIQSDASSVYNFGMPLKKSSFDAFCERAMENRYTTDENGNEVIQEITNWGYDDLEMKIYAATEDEVAQFRDLVSRADTLRYYDMPMYNIINEEAQSYFAGQKTVQEVTEIIQSRVQVYVNENR